MSDIFEITPEHDSIIRDIIKKVGQEYGAVGDGFGPSDPEVEAMSNHYNSDQGSRYLVALVNGEIVGGCGIASFNNSTEICELRKLFLLPKSRGLGLGIQLTEACLHFAAQYGYKQCYLDTLTNMKSAISLYEKLGFIHLTQPLEGTIHNGCDVWMLKDITFPISQSSSN